MLTVEHTHQECSEHNHDTGPNARHGVKAVMKGVPLHLPPGFRVFRNCMAVHCIQRLDKVCFGIILPRPATVVHQPSAPAARQRMSLT